MTMTRALAAVAAIALLASGMSSRAVAAGALHCDVAGTILKGLKDQNGEIPAFTGVTSSGLSVMITVSGKGSWSMMMVANGRLCMIAAGDMMKVEGAKPQTSAPAAPALLPHGLLTISQ